MTTAEKHNPDVSTLSLAALDVTATERDWSEGYAETWDFIQIATCGWCSEPTATYSTEDDEIDITDHDDTQCHQDAVTQEWVIDKLPDQIDEYQNNVRIEDDGQVHIYCTVNEHECNNPECSEIGAHSDPYEGDDGPMMNYYYELPDTQSYDEDDALAIINLPLCIVRLEDVGWSRSGTYALALTGGGMDLSWEICEAFMRLGFLPPIQYADLPGMAGRPQDEDDLWVIEGCKLAFKERLEQSQRHYDWGVEKLDRMKNDERAYVNRKED